MQICPAEDNGSLGLASGFMFLLYGARSHYLTTQSTKGHGISVL